MPQPIRRTITPALALLAVSTFAGAALASVRPHLAGPPPTWTGDALAVAVAWAIAVACTAWLALTTLACLVAVARGELATAARIAACAPPLARRFLQTALVGVIVLAPTAAGAATPSAPYTLHTDANGRVTAPPTSIAPTREVPVVRAPLPPTTTTVPATSTTTAPRTSPTRRPVAPPPTTATTRPATPVPATEAPVPRRERPAPVVPVPRVPHTPTRRAPASRNHVVRAGDSLWGIAAREVTRREGRPATDTETANYWLHVVAANCTTLRSGDPSLIFPDEIVTLPLD